MELGDAELCLKLEELRARGTDLAEMAQVSNFILRRREEGRQKEKKRKKMGQDPILRLPHVADRRMGDNNLYHYNYTRYMNFTVALRPQATPARLFIEPSILARCPHLFVYFQHAADG